MPDEPVLFADVKAQQALEGKTVEVSAYTRRPPTPRTDPPLAAREVGTIDYPNGAHQEYKREEYR